MTHFRLATRCRMLMPALLAALVAFGCADKQAKDRDFSTSGNKAADQRAEQRVARDQQIKGGEAGSEGAQAEEKRTLYERLGGEAGVAAIVDDFLQRVIQDPRVNWERKGLQRGGFSLSRNESIAWQPSQENMAKLKKHLAQFIALSTGGPVKYEGADMKQSHEGMRITNVEFDASVGDLKQSLEKLQIPTQEQKELLQIIESTREQIVTQR